MTHGRYRRLSVSELERFFGYPVDWTRGRPVLRNGRLVPRPRPIDAKTRVCMLARTFMPPKFRFLTKNLARYFAVTPYVGPSPAARLTPDDAPLDPKLWSPRDAGWRECAGCFKKRDCWAHPLFPGLYLCSKTKQQDGCFLR